MGFINSQPRRRELGIHKEKANAVDCASEDRLEWAPYAARAPVGSRAFPCRREAMLRDLRRRELWGRPEGVVAERRAARLAGGDEFEQS